MEKFLDIWNSYPPHQKSALLLAAAAIIGFIISSVRIYRSRNAESPSVELVEFCPERCACHTSQKIIHLYGICCEFGKVVDLNRARPRTMRRHFDGAFKRTLPDHPGGGTVA